MIEAGLTQPDEEATISIEQDEAERDAFFAGLVAAPGGEDDPNDETERLSQADCLG